MLLAVPSFCKHSSRFFSRWDVIEQYFNRASHVGVYRSADELCTKAKEINPSIGQSAPANRPLPRVLSNNQLSQQQSSSASTESENAIIPEQSPKASATSFITTNSERGSANSQSASADSEWSREQQSALEIALKTYPPPSKTSNQSEAYDRWALIAAMVLGKTRKQCMDRFRWIREEIIKRNSNGMEKPPSKSGK